MTELESERAIMLASQFRLTRAAFLIITVLHFAGLTFGQETPTSHEAVTAKLQDLIRETQKQGKKAGRLTLVWWMPTEFWILSLQAQGIASAVQAEQFKSALNGVLLLSVADGKIGAFGAIEFTPDAELRKNLSVFDQAGKQVPMVAEDKLTAPLKNLVATVKPIVANLLGSLGQNITFVVFEAKDAAARGLDPMKVGAITARLNNEEFRWRLPLGSLLPSKTCPKCREIFAGNYNFCPFDGTPLK